MPSTARTDALPTCANHPHVEAMGTCDRCGAYACGRCFRRVAGRQLCVDCLRRPQVDYLGEFKRRVWGRRDGYVWLFGIFGTLGSLASLALAVLTLGSYAPSIPMAAAALGASLVSLVVFVGYLALRRWARAGLFVYLAVQLIVAVTVASATPYEIGQAIGRLLVPFIFILAAYQSTRNKLAFRIDVTDAELEKMYRRYYDNQVARAGFGLSIFSVFVPFLALVSLPLSIWGLARSDPNAWPPVGRRKSAIAGIVLSVLGLGVTGLVTVGLLVG